MPLAAAYAALLADAGVQRGLIGPREVPRLWERHLLNCAVITDLLPGGAHVCDVGSGAGLPGVVLALRRPDLQVTLIEPLLRRAAFLEEVVAQLDLGNVAVRRARAEDLSGEVRFDVVTSRAVAPLPRLLAWSLPLVGRHGCVLAMKGASADEEVAESAAVLRHWSASAEVLSVGGSLISPPATVVRVVPGDAAGLACLPTRGSPPAPGRTKAASPSAAARAGADPTRRRGRRRPRRPPRPGADERQQ
jgi:16S rRNA (guanine527-N7)-methyltransferase